MGSVPLRYTRYFLRIKTIILTMLISLIWFISLYKGGGEYDGHHRLSGK
jgi:hypothetical protein